MTLFWSWLGKRCQRRYCGLLAIYSYVHGETFVYVRVKCLHTRYSRFRMPTRNIRCVKSTFRCLLLDIGLSHSSSGKGHSYFSFLGSLTIVLRNILLIADSRLLLRTSLLLLFKLAIKEPNLMLSSEIVSLPWYVRHCFDIRGPAVLWTYCSVHNTWYLFTTQ